MSSTENLEKTEFYWATSLYFSMTDQKTKEVKKYKLVVHVDNTDTNNIKLIQKQCENVNNYGTRCKNIADLIHPFCLSCTEIKYKLKLYQSGKQKGFKVLAISNDPTNDIVFKKGTIICQYLGELLDDPLIEKRYTAQPPPSYKSLVYKSLYYFGEHEAWKGFSLDCLRYRGILFYCDESDDPNIYNVSLIAASDYSIYGIAERDIKKNETLILKIPHPKHHENALILDTVTFQKFNDEK
jgi:hypothetical protein